MRTIETLIIQVELTEERETAKRTELTDKLQTELDKFSVEGWELLQILPRSYEQYWIVLVRHPLRGRGN